MIKKLISNFVIILAVFASALRRFLVVATSEATRVLGTALRPKFDRRDQRGPNRARKTDGDRKRRERETEKER